MLRRVSALFSLLVLAMFAAQPSTASFERPLVTPATKSAVIAGPNPHGLSTVMVQLAGAPAVVAANGIGAAAQPGIRAQSARLLAAQARLRAQIVSLGGEVLYSTHLLYNGVAALIPTQQVARARALPGVVAITQISPKRLLGGSVPFVQAPAVWGGVAGVTGRNVRIGVIDTGIDYTHATFGGPGTTAAYLANNRTAIEPGTFPTAKVVGGKDLVGDAYDPINSPALAPDDDPLDCNGHGTSVAGVAAGFGVDAAGATYSGPYSADLDINGFRVSPGVAPEASLYALKVTGCGNQTAVLGDALEWAIDPNRDGDTTDHLDVVTVSLGTPFGSPSDPDSIIAENATAAGVIVVAAAGDSGDTFYSVASPASATGAIAVAASIDLTAGAPGRPDSLLATSARGPQRAGLTTKPDIAAPGYAVVSAAIGSGNGANASSGSSLAAPHVAGAAALLRQLHRDWSPLQIKAALINTAYPVQTSGSDPYAPTYGGAGRLNIVGAVATDLLAYFVDAGGGVGADLGAVWADKAAGRERDTLTLRIENHGAAPHKFALNSFAAAAEPGIRVRPSRTQVTLQPGESTTVRVRTDVLTRRLDFTSDPTVPPFYPDGSARSYIVEQAGAVAIIDGQGARIRVANTGPEPLVDVYLNDELIARNLAFGQTSAYLPQAPGTYELAYYRAGDSATPLGTRSLNIGAGTDATIVSRAVASRPGPLKLLTLIDTNAQGVPGVGRVRFVNNYVDLANSALDLYIDGALAQSDLASAISDLALDANQLVIPPTGYFALLPGAHTAAFFAPGITPLLGAPVASVNFTVGAGEVQTLLAAPGGAQHVVAISAEPRNLIRVPYSFTPKTISIARLAADTLTLPPAASVISATIRNDGARNDASGWRNRPLVGAFELAYSSTVQLSGLATTDAARLRFVGVSSNSAITGVPFASHIFFGLVGGRDWNTPNEVQYAVFIDTNLDGVADFKLENTSVGSVYGTNPQRINDANDAFVTLLSQRQADGTFAPTDLDNLNVLGPPQLSGFDLMPFNRRVLMLRTSADLLGLGIGLANTSFRYQVVTRHRDDPAGPFATIIDQTPWLDYNLALPTIDATSTSGIFRTLPLYNDVDGTEIGVRVNRGQLAAQPDPRLLLIHFHNGMDQQAQVVPVRAP